MSIFRPMSTLLKTGLNVFKPDISKERISFNIGLDLPQFNKIIPSQVSNQPYTTTDQHRSNIWGDAWTLGSKFSSWFKNSVNKFKGSTTAPIREAEKKVGANFGQFGNAMQNITNKGMLGFSKLFTGRMSFLDSDNRINNAIRKGIVTHRNLTPFNTAPESYDAPSGSNEQPRGMYNIGYSEGAIPASKNGISKAGFNPMIILLVVGGIYMLSKGKK